MTDQPWGDEPFGGTTLPPVTPRVVPAPFTITLPPAVVAEDRTTYDHMTGNSGYMWPAEYCFGEEDGGYGCGEAIEDGQPVRKVSGQWVHDACARKAFTASTPEEAWILLADAVAARPHRFKATEIRTIVSNVARIAASAARPSSPGAVSVSSAAALMGGNPA